MKLNLYKATLLAGKVISQITGDMIWLQQPTHLEKYSNLNPQIDVKRQKERGMLLWCIITWI